VQQKLLPSKSVELTTLEYAAQCIQAGAVGGDYYDFLELGDGRTLFVLADVSGKGVPAALLMALALNTFETLVDAYPDQGALLTACNGTLAARMIQSKQNAAFLSVVLDSACHEACVANAGLVAPLLWREGVVEYVESFGLPLGATHTASYTQQTIALRNGDRLLLISDGIVEAMNCAHELWGFERLEAAFRGAGAWLWIYAEASARKRGPGHGHEWDTLLFRAGGDDSVRGYAYRTLGPVVNGAVTSGRVLLTGSAEVARPISPAIQRYARRVRTTRAAQVVQPAFATDKLHEAGPQDLVILTMKAHQVEPVVSALPALLHATTTIDTTRGAASPRALVALLTPDAQVDLRSGAHCALVGTSSNSPTFSGSAFSSDVLPETDEFDRVAPFIVSTNPTDNVLDLPRNRLQSFAVTETVTIGATSLYRFTSSDPFTSEPGGGSSGGVQQKSLVASFFQRTQFDEGSHPELPHSIDFDDDQVSYDKSGGTPGLPGPIGLRGSLADQLREWRLITRLPGFPENAAVASTTTFTSTLPPAFSGTTLLPLPLLQNNAVVAGAGFEDSPLELILQPALIDPATPVDTAVLRRNLRLEMIVQDKVIFGTGVASSAYSRQRFVFDPTNASAENFAPQSVPTPSVSNAAHPPEFKWPEVTGGEGMHVFNLISVLQLETWKIYVPAGAIGTVTLQVPKLPTSLPDGVGLIDFATIGTFQGFVESFDFDPTHIYDATTPEQYTFDPQSWWVSDLEREFLRASRSDPNFVFSTN
jgi:hypothetical protein